KVFDEIDSAQRALTLLYSEVERVEEYYIGGIDFKGFLVFIRKRRKTPESYPRKAGIPSKRPL
ncbi:MAG: Ribosomal RNA small subunit methyltransferase G, partial [bacterium 42_11]